MELRLGKIEVPRRFIVVWDDVYEYDDGGELYYIPEKDMVIFEHEVKHLDGEGDLKPGEYLKVSYVGDLMTSEGVRTVLSPAHKGDVVLITDGESPRLRKVAKVNENYDVNCQGENGVVKYGTYSLVVDNCTDCEQNKALDYLYKSGEDVATSLTYKIHEELRSNTPDYNKVNEMVRLVEYYRELYD